MDGLNLQDEWIDGFIYIFTNKWTDGLYLQDESMDELYLQNEWMNGFCLQDE
jgi:hypothetical protein